MEILHIKVNGTYYEPVKPNTQKYNCWEGVFIPICTVKKLLFGRYRIDYFDERIEVRHKAAGNIYPNARIIAYPSGINEIKYKLKNNEHESIIKSSKLLFRGLLRRT